MNKIAVFDWVNGEFAKDGLGRVPAVEGALAVEQIVIKAQQTQRGVYLIYAADPDVPDEPGDLYGSEMLDVMGESLDEETMLSEIERTVREAVIYDPFILAVHGITFERAGDTGKVTAQVDHIFDGTETIEVSPEAEGG